MLQNKRAVSITLSAFFVGFSRYLQIQPFFAQKALGLIFSEKFLTVVPINSTIVTVEIGNYLVASF